ncbi:MAG: type IV pilus twitching motility protein PilT [Candidatus Kaelpia aquatica]|nr:type IV pilus twitching motility protein PilT [Candidatus Kaelpia aquatica]
MGFFKGVVKKNEMDSSFKDLLIEMSQNNASDLHLKDGYPPIFRIDGSLTKSDHSELSSDDIEKMSFSVLNEEQREKFKDEWELDFAIEVEGVARYRINLYIQRGSLAAAIRMLPIKIPLLSKCGLNQELVVEKLLSKKRGLILVTGSTGSGKSTSIASMIEWLNENRTSHIITVEDPVEYVFESRNSVVDQREVGADTRSFDNSLRHILREDPDVILIGEMRDVETVEAALNIAETGHLVLATLHTSDAIQSINRIIDIFPSHKQSQVRVQLSFVLLAVLTQQLIAKREGPGRVLAYEMMIASHAVKSMIRESKVHQIASILQNAQAEGMSTMNQSLVNLYLNGDIDYEQAMLHSLDVEDLKKLIQRKA